MVIRIIMTVTDYHKLILSRISFQKTKNSLTNYHKFILSCLFQKTKRNSVPNPNILIKAPFDEQKQTSKS